MVSVMFQRAYAQLKGMERAGWQVSGISGHSLGKERETIVIQFQRANGVRAGGNYPAPSVPVQTSVDAAESIKPRINKMHEAILAHLEAAPTGYTAEELELATGWGGNTIRPRLKELERMGTVARLGEARKNKSGRASLVWSYVR